MNTDWLDDFKVLAETSNFTLAARKQNISQAAFSRRIQALEAWAGIELVSRDSHPISLTTAGINLLMDSERILSQINDTKFSLSNADLLEAAHVKILMPHALSVTQFSHWWKHWSDGNRLTASISVGNISDVIGKFISGSHDILICHNSSDFPRLLDPSSFRSFVLQNDRLSLYVPRKFAKSYEAIFPGTVSQPLPLLHYTQGAYFSRLVRHIIVRSETKLYGKTQLEADMSSVILESISSGLGIGWIPDSCVSERHLEKIKKVSIPGWSMNLTINAYMHRSGAGEVGHRLWKKITNSSG